MKLDQETEQAIADIKRRALLLHGIAGMAIKPEVILDLIHMIESLVECATQHGIKCSNHFRMVRRPR